MHWVIGLLFDFVIHDSTCMCYHVCGPVCLFVYKCIYMCVLLCVQIYIHIYFAPMYQRFRGLQSQTIRPALFPLFRSQRSPHPGSQCITTCLAGGAGFNSFTFWSVCPISQWGSTAADRRFTDWLTDCVMSKMKTSLHLSCFASGKFGTGTVTTFQISTLCKAPVCLFKFHHNPPTPYDCNKRTNG